MGGVGGVGGYGSPLTTDALIRHRDGIVGTWQGPSFPAQQYKFDKPAVLEQWEPWVRATVLDVELLSSLHVTTYDETPANADPTVALWYFDVDATVVPPTAAALRLASFVRPEKAAFKAQLTLVEAYADLREDRASEILAQLGPPLAFWGSVMYLHPARTRWTLEVLDAALRLANYAEMRLKHALACRRPLEYSPQVQPMILTPGHGSLPSGHATEAHIVARILWKLRNPNANDTLLGEQLMRQAARIAINRTVAGVHFPVDSVAGQLLGLTLAEYFIRRCTSVASDFTPWQFNGHKFPHTADFVFRDLFDVATAKQKAPVAPVPAYAVPFATQKVEQSDLLSWLWDKAVDEWN